MYFIEKLIQIYKKIKKKEQKVIAMDFEDNYVLEDVLTCNHHFVAIDSTKEHFACSKCGYLVTKDRLTKMNKKEP